ncbi:hypothetical protein B566_EDAN006997 [Ephemera danica]|nr:hypothetical protein B566_EDAN006997 [Ephemera danica]
MSRSSKGSMKRRAPLPPRAPLSRSTSMQDPEDPICDEVHVMPTQSATATSTLLGRWRKSLKRRMQGSPTTSNIDPTEENDDAIYDVLNLMSFDEPMDNGDSMDSEATMRVKICKEGIRTSIQDTMKNIGGNMEILEAIEDNKNNARSLLKSATPMERQVALLWACYTRRKEFLPLLVPEADLSFYTEEEGLTPLHLAAFSASPDCVRFLLNAGAVSSKPRSLTPLHCAALGNSTECIKLLLNAGGSVNLNPKDYVINNETVDSPLHSAVCANAPDCVSLLLDSGADAGAIGADGLTALHVAADLGYTECLKNILRFKSGINVDAKTQDHRGNSALHLAAEDECAETVQLLLSHGADPHTRNLKGQTALHVAAKMQAVDCVKILIPKSDVNAGDADGRTALHTAVGRAERAAETAEVLCKAPGIDLNKSDRYGHTALHIAALNELPTASAILIRHGADMTARTKRGATALGLVIRKAPAASYAIEEVLNSAIRISLETNRDKDVDLKLDFRPLLQGNNCIEVSLLSTFIAEGQKALLQHPLCKAFLHLKWQTIRKFYALRLFLSFLFVVFLSLYVLMFLTNNCNDLKTVQNATAESLGRSRNDNIVFEYKDIKPRIETTESLAPRARFKTTKLNCSDVDSSLGLPISEANFKSLKYIVNWGILVLALVEILRKAFGLVSAISAPTVLSVLHALKNYVCQMDNILEWFTLVSVFLISNLIWHETKQWQVHLGAFAVLCGWTNLMMMVGQLPLFGAYVSMYTCVLREFAKLLLAYLCLLIGFAISFCVIFKQAKEFSNPLIAFVKVLVMMTGELEFNDLLIDKDEAVANKTVNGTDEFQHEGKFLQFSAHVIFVACLLLVTVALMNLLVGIAVHDIQGLRASAGLSKLENQADLVGYVETALSGCCSSMLFSTRLQCVHNTKQKRANSTLLRIRPHNQRDTRLPREIVKEAYELAKRCNNFDKGRSLYKRNNSKGSNSTDVGFCTDTKAKGSKTVSLRNPRMRRTMYVKLDDNTQDQTSTELDNETLASLKQISEENQAALSELRDAVNETREMLRQILSRNPIPAIPPYIRNE